jgi:hypothetical protein
VVGGASLISRAPAGRASRLVRRRLPRLRIERPVHGETQDGKNKDNDRTHDDRSF